MYTEYPILIAPDKYLEKYRRMFQTKVVWSEEGHNGKINFRKNRFLFQSHIKLIAILLNRII